MGWTFLYMMLFLKLPIAGLLGIVWWAIHQTPEGFESPAEGDGGSRRPRHPRPPRGRSPRRRDPHGAPSPASPARTRTLVARGRTTHR